MKVMKDLSFLNKCNRRKGLYDCLTLPNLNPLEMFHPNICVLLFRLQCRDSFNIQHWSITSANHQL